MAEFDRQRKFYSVQSEVTVLLIDPNSMHKISLNYYRYKVFTIK